MPGHAPKVKSAPGATLVTPSFPLTHFPRCGKVRVAPAGGWPPLAAKTTLPMGGVPWDLIQKNKTAHAMQGNERLEKFVSFLTL